MPNELFISYSRKDSVLAYWIEARLRERGIDPWIDSEDIPPAVPWKGEMLTGCQICESFLFLISPDSVGSDACSEELRCALRHNKRIIPAVARIPNNANYIHPVLKELNWVRFDLDRDKAIAQLLRLIESPQGYVEANRPSAIVRIHYPDDSTKDFSLIRNCYWVGRRPTPDDRVAGAIIIPDPNPNAPITSRFHCELKVQGDKWIALNRSDKNGILIYPPSPSGLLRNGSKIFIGHCFLEYREIRLVSSPAIDDHPTYPSQ
jgi:hypothetical protein